MGCTTTQLVHIWVLICTILPPSPTLTLWCLGPGTAGGALCNRVADNCVRGIAVIRRREAVIGRVSSDYLVVNDHSIQWDRSETAGYSYQDKNNNKTPSVSIFFHLLNKTFQIFLYGYTVEIYVKKKSESHWGVVGALVLVAL